PEAAGTTGSGGPGEGAGEAQGQRAAAVPGSQQAAVRRRRREAVGGRAEGGPIGPEVRGAAGRDGSPGAGATPTESTEETRDAVSSFLRPAGHSGGTASFQFPTRLRRQSRPSMAGHHRSRSLDELERVKKLGDERCVEGPF